MMPFWRHLRIVLHNVSAQLKMSRPPKRNAVIESEQRGFKRKLESDKSKKWRKWIKKGWRKSQIYFQTS
jgi:hypothetical protein